MVQDAVIIFEDEATFKLDATLHQTWSVRGIRPIIETTGAHEPIHVFGGIAIESGKYHYMFAERMDAKSYTDFLQQLTRYYYPRKIILPRDNAPWHRGPNVATFLEENKKYIEPVVIPPYWPELNAQEYIWHFVRQFSTHNRFFENRDSLHDQLLKTFMRIQRNPQLVMNYVAPFCNNV